MAALLAANKIAIYVIAGIVGLIVFSVAMHFINREFRIRYRLNLIGGGLLMLLAIGAAVGGILLLTKTDKKIFGFVLFGVTALFSLITLIYDCKKCGGAGVLAFLCQILFCVPALCLVLELFSGKGTTMARDYRREERDIRRARERRGYDDYNDKRYY